jgi:hypothetical protein
MPMLPADTTRTRFASERANKSTLQSALQEELHRPSSSPHGAILLLNFESGYRDRLSLVLRRLGFSVLIPESDGIPLSKARDEYFLSADFILFDLTRLNHDAVWLPLRRICRLRKIDGMPVMVHCFSRIDRGEDFHLMVEGLGARMDYYAA